MSDDTNKADAEENAAESNRASREKPAQSAAAAQQEGAALAEELAAVPETGHDEVPSLIVPPRPEAKKPPSPPPLASKAEVSPIAVPPAPPPPPVATTEQTPKSDQEMKERVADILKAIKLPERRVAEGATEHPKLEETALTETPYRAESQLAEAPLPKVLKKEPPKKVEAATQEKGEQSPVVPLHTMKSDLQDIVREDKVSLVRAASMEADKKKRAAGGQEQERVVHRTHSVGLFVTASIALFALGGAALFGVYYVQTTKPSATAPAPIGLVFAEQRTVLPIDTQSPAALRQTIATLLRGGSSGSIVEIVPVVEYTTQQQARSATLAEFLHALGAHQPDDLLRALSDTYFFGVHAADVPSPVLVIPVVSYDRAFAGMLSWESKMDSDLSALFVQVSAYKPIVIMPQQVGTSTASTTPRAAPTPQFLPPRTFEDLVMKNYDVRGLRDDNGNIILYYSFPTQNLLIISASPYTFPEILSRLQAARKL